MCIRFLYIDNYFGIIQYEEMIIVIENFVDKEKN